MKQVVTLCLLLCLIALATAKVIGVSQQDQEKYIRGKNKYFQCFDKSATISVDKINDDFCDCKDGSDEPGTSACSFIKTTQFYCENKGYLPKNIFTSLVNDGFCDCCDGSDEYNGKISCPNTCHELGGTIRAEYAQKLDVIKRALAQKHEQVRFGQSEILRITMENNEKKQKLELWREELKKLEQAKELAEKQEAIERNLLREAAEAAKQATAAATQATAATTPAADASSQSSPTTTTPAPAEPVDAKVDETTNPEVIEMLKQASQNRANKIAESFTAAPAAPEEAPAAPAEPTPAAQEEEKKDDDFSSHKTEEAEKARAEYDAKKKDIDNLQREADDLATTLSFDYGADSQFFSLRGKCFSIDSKEYTYEMCPYGRSSQKDKRGYGDVSLGSFSKWDPAHTVMKFENGQTCWNGPARSNIVTFVCGAENKVTKVDEPQRCVYAMNFETPEACTVADEAEWTAKLKQLE